MSDGIIETSQLVNGVAILLSFYVGYKYGSMIVKKQNNSESLTEKKVTSEMFYRDSDSNYKMLLVVRNDLKMGKGKIGAQCGHAAVGAYQIAMRKIPHLVRRWEDSGSKKIAVKVESERELMDVQQAAKANKFVTCLIRDAGRTQIEPNTKTVLAIGPAASSELDPITRHLKLL